VPNFTLNDLWLLLAALGAGVMNALAGGGTLLTFPALQTVVPLIVANATSSTALAPASLASVWGYRREITAARHWLVVLLLPTVLGSIVGAATLIVMPEKYFALLVPWLLLLAAVLFLVQPYLAKRTGHAAGSAPSGRRMLAVAVFQFFVAVYGGYFGAGMGIMMLSALSVMGMSDIHEMNAVKSVLAALINSLAIAVFILDGKVDWYYAFFMAGTAILGGFLGAHYGRRLPRALVRWVVIAIGFGLAAHFFYRQYWPS